MSANPIDDIRDFERANAGNAFLLVLKQFGASLADDWLFRYPPPWTEDMVRAFTENLHYGVAAGLREHVRTRADRRSLKRCLKTYQCVALLSANDRIIEHSLSGFVGGTA